MNYETIAVSYEKRKTKTRTRSEEGQAEHMQKTNNDKVGEKRNSSI